MSERPQGAGSSNQIRLRKLATDGRLTEYAMAAPADDRALLVSAAYEITWPIVFGRVTRRVELARGHLACYSSIRHLADECLDGFHDDVEAVVEDLLTHSTKPIINLEAWITSRLNAATVDAYRRRRGQRGALQRPRLPKWLAEAVGNDPWLTELATQILVWVGVDATAGAAIWPLDSWSQRRAAITGDQSGSDAATVAREIEFVLRAMRRKHEWFTQYVEEPQGRKQPPIGGGVYLADHDIGDQAMPTTARDDVDDGRLMELAATAVDVIAHRLAQGEDITTIAAEVVKKVFCLGTGAGDIDRAPLEGRTDDEQISTFMTDPAVIQRIIDAVHSIAALQGSTTT
ncbi:hypothetical protein F4553_003027 [Allocatelliglobosispora scoriae]|uniref:Uncharacterized protein n=1 Tax=Allocatelliglobosispora scoriae TaxID=643052 RepID=A0A841BQI8_9ACTN|nr:hypothetical protein [Allocatelliglobosispora scoriae]MBB5869648.1 hypothetical protein [Allocatelliglobosispora scoriae]